MLISISVVKTLLPVYMNRYTNFIGFSSNEKMASSVMFYLVYIKTDANYCLLQTIQMRFVGSSVSSTEKYIDTRLMKAWTSIDRLSIILKSDLTDKMKRSFFQSAIVSILLYGCTTWTAITQECCEQYWTSPGDNTLQGTNYTTTCLPSRKLSKIDKPDMQDTAGEARTSS